MLLRGDFHVHPLGHGPFPATGPRMNPAALACPVQRGVLRSQAEREARILAMLQAAQAKGLDFFVNTDHLFNTTKTAQRLAAENSITTLVIPGFEATPVTTRPDVNHVIVAGVAPRRLEALTNPSLRALKSLTVASGGLLIAAHPQIPRWFYRGVLLWDAYEGFNQSAQQSYAYPVPIPRLAVSDAHCAHSLLDWPGVTLVDADARTPDAILEAVRAGRVTMQGVAA